MCSMMADFDYLGLVLNLLNVICVLLANIFLNTVDASGAIGYNNSKLNPLSGCQIPQLKNRHLKYNNVSAKPGEWMPVNSTLVFNCAMGWGFKNLPVPYVKCKPNGNWSAKPFCKKNYGCKIPLLKDTHTRYNNQITVPGKWLPINSFLVFGCAEGWEFKNLTAPYVRCKADGNWLAMPLCTRKCKMFSSETVRFEVQRCDPDDIFHLDCEDYVPSGYRHKPLGCKKGFYTYETLKTLTCNLGEWDHAIPVCKKEVVEKCGVEVHSEGEAYFTPLTRSLSPWHVAVYEDIEGDKIYLCNGNLISTKAVITAANCLYKNGNKPQGNENISIAAGKLHRDWTHYNDKSYTGSAEVRVINVKDTYKYEQYNSDDIVILILATPIQINNFVRPICLDLTGNRSFTDGNLGTTAVWRKVISNSTTWTQENVSTLKIIRQHKRRPCPSSFLLPLNSSRADTFCAHFKGTTSCRGDSGSGLAQFVFQSSGVKQWYLTGITSVIPDNYQTTECVPSDYIKITNLSPHLEWIRAVLNDEAGNNS